MKGTGGGTRGARRSRPPRPTRNPFRRLVGRPRDSLGGALVLPGLLPRPRQDAAVAGSVRVCVAAVPPGAVPAPVRQPPGPSLRRLSRLQAGGADRRRGHTERDAGQGAVGVRVAAQLVGISQGQAGQRRGSRDGGCPRGLGGDRLRRQCVHSARRLCRCGHVGDSVPHLCGAGRARAHGILPAGAQGDIVGGVAQRRGAGTRVQALRSRSRDEIGRPPHIRRAALHPVVAAVHQGAAGVESTCDRQRRDELAETAAAAGRSSGKDEHCGGTGAHTAFGF
eukprot:ctg_2165.g423